MKARLRLAYSLKRLNVGIHDLSLFTKINHRVRKRLGSLRNRYARSKRTARVMGAVMGLRKGRVQIDYA